MKAGIGLGLLGASCLGLLVAAAPSGSPVADAARSGDRVNLQSWLQQGADVNAPHGDGMSALHWAAERGDVEMARMLLTAGANVKAVTRIGRYTPLHVAAKSGSAPVAALLLDAGADANAVTASGTTPLHLAAASGDPVLVNALLDHGADVNARENEWGQTPLIFAASQNRAEAIRALLARGADPGLTTKVVDLTAEAKLARAAKKLERKVLDSYRIASKDKSEEESPTATELQAAIVAGRELYLSGVVPEEKEEGDRDDREDFLRENIDTKGGLTALLHAARQGYVASAMALLDGGADVNQVSAGDGTSPLLMAAINAQFDLVLRLLERGANPNLASKLNGVTPLWATVNAEWQPRTRYPQPQEHELQKATYLDVMAALLKAGADPNARLTQHPWYMVYTGCGNRNCGLEDTEGSTAFWRAAYATDVDAMRLLAKYGADPNLPTKAPPPRPPRSGTAQEISAEGSHPVQPAGPGLWPATDAASVEPDPSGLPRVKAGGPGVYPIHAASGVGYGEGFAGNAHRHAPGAWLAAVKYLVEELGADVNARDYNGYNALHHAAARGDDELILYLVSKGCDVKAVSRTGQTTADMANGPVQRVSPFPETVKLLESLGSKNNHKCVSC